MFHDFLLFDTRSGKVTGRFRTTTPDTLPHPPSPDFGQVAVSDEAHKKLIARLTRAEQLVGTIHGNQIASLRLEPRFQGKLMLSCDASDADEDGKPELAADGSSKTRITARLVDAKGAPMPQVSAAVRFMVTRGSLSSRSIDAKNGEASVDITAASETVSATVTAQAEGFEPCSLTLEFIPPQEFKQRGRPAGAAR